MKNPTRKSETAPLAARPHAEVTAEEEGRLRQVGSAAKKVLGHTFEIAGDALHDGKMAYLGRRLHSWGGKLTSENTDSADDSLIFGPELQKDVIIFRATHMVASLAQNRAGGSVEVNDVVLTVTEQVRDTARVAFEKVHRNLGEEDKFHEMYQKGRAALHNIEIIVSNYERLPVEQKSDPKCAADLLGRVCELAGRVEDALRRLEDTVRLG